MNSLIQLAITLTLLISSTVAFGQHVNQKVFSSLPANQRQRFIERLDLYIARLLRNNQSGLNELYNEETLCSLCKGKCTQDCAPPMTVEVPKSFRSELLEFRPINISAYGSEGNWDYSIEVEQKERLSWEGKPPRIVKHKVRMFAVYEKGDWYFSLVSVPGMIYL
jgi:hypothetical protein